MDRPQIEKKKSYKKNDMLHRKSLDTFFIVYLIHLYVRYITHEHSEECILLGEKIDRLKAEIHQYNK